MEFRDDKFKGRLVKVIFRLLSIGGCEFVRSKSNARRSKRRDILLNIYSAE